MPEFEDPFADLSHLDNPQADLERAIWRNGSGEHNAQLGDVTKMTGLLLIAEYETTDGFFGTRMIVRGVRGGSIPHWRAKGLLAALSEFIHGEITDAQTDSTFTEDEDDSDDPMY